MEYFKLRYKNSLIGISSDFILSETQKDLYINEHGAENLLIEQISSEGKMQLEVGHAIERGQKVERLISAYLRERLYKNEITIQELAAFVESDAVKTVERYLSKGYLEMVRPIIQSQAYSLIPDEKKQEFLSLL